MDRKAVHFCYVSKLSYLYFTDGVITIRMGSASRIQVSPSAPAIQHRAGEKYIFSADVCVLENRKRYFAIRNQRKSGDETYLKGKP